MTPFLAFANHLATSGLVRLLMMGAGGALMLALAACSTPVVSPELMPKARFADAQLQAMSSAELQARRDELAAQRARASDEHARAEQTCWQRFAVTPCITKSAQKRRAIHDQLRADDIALEDEQRRRRLLRANERLQLKAQDKQPE